jgi:hypothetical protein
MSKVMVLDMKNDVGNSSTLIVHFQATYRAGGKRVENHQHETLQDKF